MPYFPASITMPEERFFWISAPLSTPATCIFWNISTDFWVLSRPYISMIIMLCLLKVGFNSINSVCKCYRSLSQLEEYKYSSIFESFVFFLQQATGIFLLFLNKWHKGYLSFWTAWNIGVIFDSTMTLSKHIDALVESAFYNLHKTANIRQYSSFDTAKTPSCCVSSLSKIDNYCNSLFFFRAERSECCYTYYC